MSTNLDSLSLVFKAFADPIRLRMAALLSERRRCGQELSSALRISPATVSHHLRLLRRAGLVVESRQAPYTFYQLDLRSLHEAVRSVSDPQRSRDMTVGAGLSAEATKVLRTFFDGPRLLSIPSQRKKKGIVLEEILRRLPRRREYSERELSGFIEAIHPDFCSIRREMIIGRYMVREGGRYRLTDRGQACIRRSSGG